jgi:prepilin-type N-terminal cleavage/methylation domain-containing protein
MSRARTAAAALRRDQRGFTLIELLVASMLGLIVVGAGLSIFISAVRSEPRNASKVAAIQQARFTVDRIVRELRQGREIAKSPTPSSSQLAIVTYVKASGCTGSPTSTATLCKVTYTCTTSTCTRTVAQADGSAAGSPVQVVTGLSSSNVFTYSPSLPAEPTYVGVTLSLASDGDPIVLGDGAALRNPSEEA